jgi:3-oxoadipate enol-lactonase
MTNNEATEVSGDIEADGGRLHVEATGKGPAVVLLHGGSADSRMWQGQLAALAGHYRVIRYDLRGLGQSPPPAASYRMSDDLTAVLDHQGVDSAALVGFSTGGTIALEFAARYPARAAALVLIGAIVPAEPGQIPGYEAARQELTLQLAPREAARARGDLAAAVAADLDVWASAQHGAARAELAAWGMANPYFHAGMGEHEQLGPVSDAAVAAVAAPTLVMVGDQDTGLSRLCADYLADTIPGAQLQVFADADHFVSTARPAAFNKALRSFLDNVML